MVFVVAVAWKMYTDNDALNSWNHDGLEAGRGFVVRSEILQSMSGVTSLGVTGDGPAW